MERSEVFGIVETERTYQDTTYNPDEVLSSGQTRKARDLDVTAHLTLLDIYIDKAKKAWLAKGDNFPALQQIAKVAAIAVRALERAGGADALKTKGLR
jgi:hypothetical protein